MALQRFERAYEIVGLSLRHVSFLASDFEEAGDLKKAMRSVLGLVLDWTPITGWRIAKWNGWPKSRPSWIHGSAHLWRLRIYW
jgi:hypothetical protein